MSIALGAIVVGGIVMIAVLLGTMGRGRDRHFRTRKTWRGPQ